MRSDTVTTAVAVHKKGPGLKFIAVSRTEVCVRGTFVGQMRYR